LTHYRASVFGLCAAAFTMAAAAPALGGPKAILELFTSQGCSSCPPADRLLGEYADRDDVLVLSFNVDYWDYLGWKDTLASRDNSDRQRAYAAARDDRDVYTPQIVVNGRGHIVGSDKKAIDAEIAKSTGLPVPIELSETDDAVTVHVGANPSAEKATLWLVLYQRQVSVPVERGENTGKTLTYSNVVRKLRPIAMWNGEAMNVDLPKSEMEKVKTKRCAVLLQDENDAGQPGPILGAAMLNPARLSPSQ